MFKKGILNSTGHRGGSHIKTLYQVNEPNTSVSQIHQGVYMKSSQLLSAAVCDPGPGLIRYVSGFLYPTQETFLKVKETM